MATNNNRKSPTSFVVGGDGVSHTYVKAVRQSDTKVSGVGKSVLVPGRYVARDGKRELTASFEPKAIDRKLAIRKINGQIEGVTAKSNTSY